LAASVAARAQDANTAPRTELDPSITLDPSAPQVGALPGGVTPAFGQRPMSEGEWRFDFHGLVTAPLNMGFNTRPNQGYAYPCPAPAGGMPPCPGQSKLVLHAPPVVPDDLETFSHTGVVPTTYAQINFSEGNSIVTAVVSIIAKQANVSEGFLEPAAQLGISDVFVAVNPPLTGRFHVNAFVGAFTARYGTSGEYDEGRYGTPLIARISGVGELATGRIGLGDFTLSLEEGVHGQTNKAASSITPDVWNNFADPGTGSTFVVHGHAGLSWRRNLTVGGHLIHAFTMDDRAGTAALDGSIDVYAGDARLNMGRFGHLYAAVAYTDAVQARSVSRVISVLNTQGGPGLMDNYLGPLSGGTGTLTTVGGQYDLSIGRLVSYPVPFSGDGPDLYVSVFGMMTHVTSVDHTTDAQSMVSTYDGVDKRKFGVEATYSFLPWLATSGRLDQVDPNTKNRDFSFAEATARLILHSDWQSTDQIVLQYTHWFYGSRTTVRDGEPPVPNEGIVPDGNMLSLSASMWW